METIGTQNIPVGRIAKVLDYPHREMYVARFYAKELLRIWMNSGTDGKMSIQSIDHDIDWKLEILPETTTITLLCDGGDNWQKNP